MSKTAQVLRELMQSRSITENELGRQTGVPQPTIHRILTGESQSPRSNTLRKLSTYFNISPACLMGEDFQNPEHLKHNLTVDEIELLKAYRMCDKSQRKLLLNMISGIK